jgi:hypothetical protein
VLSDDSTPPYAPSAPPRPSFQSDFEELEPERPVPSAPPRPSFQSDFEELEPERPVPSAPPRPSFQSDFSSNEPDDFESRNSVGSRSFETTTSSSSALQPSFGMEPEFPRSDSSKSRQSGPGSQGSSVLEGAPGAMAGAMMGGARHTRCKHCHSRLKYTRKK